jgi:hypothetical protein
MHQKKNQSNPNSLFCYPLSNQVPSKGSMKKSYSTLAGKAIYIFAGFAVLVNFTGLFNTLMGPDAILYASISKTMVLKNDYVDNTFEYEIYK